MKTLICRILFMACIGFAGHLIINTSMYAESFLFVLAGLAVVFYDAFTDIGKH